MRRSQLMRPRSSLSVLTLSLLCACGAPGPGADEGTGDDTVALTSESNDEDTGAAVDCSLADIVLDGEHVAWFGDLDWEDKDRILRIEGSLYADGYWPPEDFPCLEEVWELTVGPAFQSTFGPGHEVLVSKSFTVLAQDQLTEITGFRFPEEFEGIRMEGPSTLRFVRGLEQVKTLSSGMNVTGTSELEVASQFAGLETVWSMTLDTYGATELSDLPALRNVQRLWLDPHGSARVDDDGGRIQIEEHLYLSPGDSVTEIEVDFGPRQIPDFRVHGGDEIHTISLHSRIEGFDVVGLPKLTTVSGLSLSSVPAAFRLERLDSLRTLEISGAGTKVSGDFELRDLPLLESIEGLHTIDEVRGSRLVVVDTPLLDPCVIDAWVSSLVDVPGSVDVPPATGCP